MKRIRSRVSARVVALAATALLALAGRATSAIAAPPAACDVAGVVAKALPAVVNVSVVRVIDPDSGGGTGTERLELAVGSGFLIEPSGIIVTNQHVIEKAALIKVTFNDRSEVLAHLVQAALIDLALLKVDVPRPLPALRFADSNELKIGQPVIAVGNPLGIGTSVSTGVVSALDRDLMRTPFDNFVQTDAAINPGNSGGPLLDCDGNIVGVNTALYSNNKMLGSIGLGFALPSNVASMVTARLLHPDDDSPNWFGLRLQDLTNAMAVVFGRPNLAGAIITGIDPNSPAAHASLAPGDIITAVDGQNLKDSRAILRYTVLKPQGELITFSIWRQGHSTEVQMRGQLWPHLGMFRDEVLASAASIARAQAMGLGLHVIDITPADRQRLSLDDVQGVLVDQVVTGSQADLVGLRTDEVIEKVDDHTAASASEVTKDLSTPRPATGDLIALLVRGKTNTRWITLYVGHVDVTHLVVGPSQMQSAAATPGPSAGSQAAAPR